MEQEAQPTRTLNSAGFIVWSRELMRMLRRRKMENVQPVALHLLFWFLWDFWPMLRSKDSHFYSYFFLLKEQELWRFQQKRVGKRVGVAPVRVLHVDGDMKKKKT